MNTTLTPPPTEAEKRMLAEWAIRFCTMQHELNHPECTLSECFDFVETMLTEFRDRYGVTGEPSREQELQAEIARLREALEYALGELTEGGDISHLKRMIREALKGGPHEAV